MPNLSYNANKEIQVIPLSVVASVSGGYTISTTVAEFLPSVEEIIPRNPDAKLNFHRSPEVVVEDFRSSLMAKCLAKIKAKCGLPDQVELLPTNDNEVYTHHPGYCSIFGYPFTIGYSFPLPYLVEELAAFIGFVLLSSLPLSIR